MTEATFQQFVNEFVEELRKVAPRDTGRLADDAIRFYFEPKKAVVEVNIDIAPYMPYTNEPWISPRWNGKKNPNEAWWNEQVGLILAKLVPKYKGVLK